ncbi:MAG: S8 family serine peptidase [Burkholderiales bacterium]|nr:S8 family serine peptidase [Burkholderiales bacterium]
MARKYLLLHEPLPAPAAAPGSARRRGGVRAGVAARPAPAAAAPRVETDLLAPRAAHELLRQRKVAAAAPVMPMRLIAPVRTAKAPAARSASAWGIAAVGADTSPWDGSGIVVAVLDTGIDPVHPAFAGVDLRLRNFTDEADPHDQHGHGTHCAGTIFGRDVDGRRIGVARGVARALIGKVIGGESGGSDQIAQAIQWALAEGAHVISMSLGIDFPGYVKELIDDAVPAELATSIALQDYRANILLFERLAGFVQARSLMAEPTMLIAAAGNESRRDEREDFEIAVSPPAVADGFVSVAALGRSRAGHVVAPFSNTGARLAGPGVEIVSARAGGGLVAMDGTSMATPHVAGVAALWAHKLAAGGALRHPTWADRVVGAATTAGLKPGFDPADVGAGMVQAPQD